MNREMWEAEYLKPNVSFTCIFCGHIDSHQLTAATKDSIKQHIVSCPKHPLSAVMAVNRELLAACKAALGAFENNNCIDWNDLVLAIAKAEELQ